MRSIIIVFCAIFFLTACKRHLSHEETEKELKSAMQSFLDTQKNIDTNKVKFVVLDVEYFEDKNVYECEFKINMKQTRTDTLGTMGAWISKDFSVVKRKF
jgi:hypothetical protein